MSRYPPVVQQLLTALWSILVHDDDEPAAPVRDSGMERAVEAAIWQAEADAHSVDREPNGPTKPTA